MMVHYRKRAPLFLHAGYTPLCHIRMGRVGGWRKNPASWRYFTEKFVCKGRKFP